MILDAHCGLWDMGLIISSKYERAAYRWSEEDRHVVNIIATSSSGKDLRDITSRPARRCLQIYERDPSMSGRAGDRSREAQQHKSPRCTSVLASVSTPVSVMPRQATVTQSESRARVTRRHPPTG
ncbi:hypothetical protein J6590_039048 [Homalodisca vitripennis]|nr:hypothetical protein J6590_039048 [Homalodisca vitripennis]